VHGLNSESDGGFWRMSPAFDLNPFPDKDRESKTWLSEDTGPIESMGDLMSRAAYFRLDEVQARQSLREVVQAVDQWRAVAASAAVGMSPADIEEFAPAFEHSELEGAKTLAR